MRANNPDGFVVHRVLACSAVATNRTRSASLGSIKPRDTA